MKKIVLLILLTGLINAGFSQTPNWLWAEGSGGGNWTGALGITYSHLSGNLYMTGRVSSSLTITGKTVTSPHGSGSCNPFSGEFDLNGNCGWLTLDDFSGGNDYEDGFTLDDSDNSYTTGIIGSGQGMYVYKVNSAGTIKWSYPVNGGGPVGLGVAVDNSTGDVYAAGLYNNSITFGSTTLTSAGSADIYLIKLDMNGNLLWAKSFGANGNDEPTGLAVDKAGNLYMTGMYEGAPTYGTFALPDASANGANLFVAQLNSSGVVQWVTTATSALQLNGAWWVTGGMTLDSCANIYLVGDFMNTATFGSSTVTSNGSGDMFVAKCLNNGTWAWVRSGGGPSDDRSYGIALDKDNDVYITGAYTKNADFGGGNTISGPGGSNTFVAKYGNLLGNLEWVQTDASTGNSNGSGITVDNQKFVYIVGSFSGNASFGSTAMTCSSTQNVLIAKLDTVPTRRITDSPDSVYCPGTSSQLPFVATGGFNNGNVFTAQLSDANGSFANPVVLGTSTGTTSGTISILIPAGTPPGNNYVIRVVSSNPVVTVSTNYYYCNTTATPNTVRIGGNFATTISPNTSTCPNAQVPLSVTGGTTYLWSPLATLSCDTCHNPTATPSVTTTYYVTVTNNTCPPLKDSVVVTVIPYPVLVAGTDTSICVGGAASLSVSGATSYAWSPSAGLSCATCANLIASPSASTTYTVTGTNQGCSKTDSVFVSVIAAPTLLLQDVTVCYGVATPLNAITNGALVWSPADQLNCAQCNSPVATMTYPTTYTVTASTGVCTTTGTIVVKVDTPFVYAGSDTTIFKGTTAQLLADGATTYSWLPTDGLSNSSISNPLASPLATTNYTVIGYDLAGCATTDQVLVTVNDPCLIPLPNAFSPNGDGINDLFGIVNPYIDKILDFEIYNRWGELVFQTNYMDHGWDGTFNGRAEPVGTYVYFVKSICEGNEVTFKGNVTLIR